MAFATHFRILVETGDGYQFEWDCTDWPTLEAAKSDISLQAIRALIPEASKLMFYRVSYEAVASETLIEHKAENGL